MANGLVSASRLKAFAFITAICLGAHPVKAQGSSTPDLSGNDPHWIKVKGSQCWTWDANPIPGETVTWDGSCEGQLVAGNGDETWYTANNIVQETLSGGFEGGVQEGIGTLTNYDSNGVKTTTVQGVFTNGIPNGRETITDLDPLGHVTKITIGDVSNNTLNGEGTVTAFNSNGTVSGSYSGIWKNGVLQTVESGDAPNGFTSQAPPSSTHYTMGPGAFAYTPPTPPLPPPAYDISTLDVAGVKLWMTPSEAEAVVSAKLGNRTQIQLKYAPSRLSPPKSYISQIVADNGDYAVTIFFIEIAPGDAPNPVEADEVFMSFSPNKSVTEADATAFQNEVMAKYSTPTRTTSDGGAAYWCSTSYSTYCNADGYESEDPLPELNATFASGIPGTYEGILDLTDANNPLTTSVTDYLNKQNNMQQKSPF